MAQKILYPVYITSGAGFSGILSDKGDGTDYKELKSGVKEVQIGTIAFDNKLQGLSKACVLNNFKVALGVRNLNGLATNGVNFVLSSKIINSYYISGNEITINSSYGRGNSVEFFNAEYEWQDFGETYLIYRDLISDFIGCENKLLGVYAKVTRSGAVQYTQAHMRNLYATVDYTPRYYARFYNGDSLYNEQIVDGGQKPTLPPPPEKPGYTFRGWKDSRDNTGVYINGVPGSDETDTSYTAVYDKNPTITAEITSGKGTVSQIGSTEIGYGSSITYTFTPDEDYYYIKNVYVDGVAKGSQSSYTFTNVTSNHTIEVEFSRYCIIKINPAKNGLIKYKYGDSEEIHTVGQDVVKILYAESTSNNYVTVYSEPDEGYSTENFDLAYKTSTADAYQIISYRSGSRTQLTDYWEYEFSVEFRKKKFDINIENSTGGKVSGPDIVEYGDSALYSVVPDDHYLISDIFLDGASVLSQAVFDGNNATLSVDNITTNRSISATFKRVVYVTKDSGENGSISGETVVDYGSSHQYTISADAGYSIDKIYIDGELWYQATLVCDEYSVYLSKLNKDTTIKALFTNKICELKITQSTEGGYIGGNEVGNYISGTELTFLAVAGTGWYFKSWNNGCTEKSLIFNISEDIDLTATFGKFDYTVTALSKCEDCEKSHGVVEPESQSTNVDDEVEFKAIADRGYIFKKWEDGSTNPARTYTAPASDATITAYFTENYFEVIGLGEGGTVEVTGEEKRESDGKYKFGSKVTIKAIPDEGWYFVEWKANIAAVPEHEVDVTYEDIIYEAEFARYEYKVDTSARIGGKITESEIIKHGDDLEIVIENNIGYKLTDVLLDGESIFGLVTITLDGGRYILTNIREPHNIEAVFTERRYNGRKNLIDYYPPVLQRIIDFIELTNAQQPMVGRVWDAVAFAYDNQFIDDATEEGVKNWEKDYGIVPAKSDTLKDRKQRLKAMWVPNSRYTYKWLVNWLKTVTGNENIKPPEIEDYSIKTQLPGDCNYFEILDNMKRYVPANMHIEPTVKLKTSQQNLYTGAAFRLKIKTQLRIEK